MGAKEASYNRCIKNCDLENIYSNKLYGEVFNRGAPTKSAEFQISLEPSAVRVEETKIEASLYAKIDGYLKANAKKPAWTIEARIIAVYIVDEKDLLSDEDRQLFASRQGVITLLPYLRSVVSSLSTDIGIGPITLPIMKFFPTLHEEDGTQK